MDSDIDRGKIEQDLRDEFNDRQREIGLLWDKWDKEGEPSDQERYAILEKHISNMPNGGWVSAYQCATPVIVSALIGYRYRHQSLFEFLNLFTQKK